MEAQQLCLHRFVLCLLALFWCVVGGASQQSSLIETNDRESVLQLYAGKYELTRSSNGGVFLQLSEGVELIYQGRRLITQNLILDTQTQEAHSETPFLLIAPEGTLRGTQVRYNYERNHGYFANFEANVLKVIICGETLEGDLNRFTAYQISATTCESTPPDYLIEAQSVQLLDGTRLRLRNARLKIRGRSVLRLPYMMVRLRETAQLVSLPSPVYRQPDGWGLRSQIELPLSQHTYATLAGTVYLNAIPETRVFLATALTAGSPQTGDLELRARFEGSPLYNLRVSPEQEIARLSNRTVTLRLEHSTHFRPLFAPTRDTRVSRSEIAFDMPLRWRNGVGVITARIGSLSERVEGYSTSYLRRWSLEVEWCQPLMERNNWELWLHLWASHNEYDSRQSYHWMRPQISVRWRPTETFALMLGYSRSDAKGSSPLLVDRSEVRNEFQTRAEWLLGNLRSRLLFRWDVSANALRDMQVQLGWRIHCVEPTLFWRRSPSTLLLGVNLTAFM